LIESTHSLDDGRLGQVGRDGDSGRHVVLDSDINKWVRSYVSGDNERSKAVDRYKVNTFLVKF
jgi:hypothetical protein